MTENNYQPTEKINFELVIDIDEAPNRPQRLNGYITKIFQDHYYQLKYKRSGKWHYCNHWHKNIILGHDEKALNNAEA